MIKLYFLFLFFKNGLSKHTDECTEKYKMNDFLLNREYPGKKIIEKFLLM